MRLSVPQLAVCLLNLQVITCIHAQDTLEPGVHPCRVTSQVEPCRTIREADVMWERRVWRVIDLNEKVNSSLAMPQGSRAGCMDLFGIIRHGLLDEGSITAYDPGPEKVDDAFTLPMTRPELERLFDTIDTLRPVPIARIMIKEDWIFDRQRGEMIVRIIGIAPMIEVRGELGEVRGYEPIFWLYYPECRLLFARWVHREDKDGNAISYESYFAQRRFKSTIIKVANMQERRINAYRSGLDALLEGEAIRDQLYNMGFDLWHY